MEQIIDSLHQFWQFTGFANCSWQNFVMIAIGIGFITVAILKEWEPLLLVPIGFGMIIGNIPMFPGLNIGIYEDGTIDWDYSTGGFFKEMTESEKRLAILDEAVTTFGKEKQVDMMIEEMAELTKALLNERRGRESNISEEIADVLIMAEQMKIIFNNADSVEAYRQGKINRLAIKIATIKSGGEE